MDFEFELWINKFHINKVIIKLLEDQSKIVCLYAIKLLKIIIDTCENCVIDKIINPDLCNILINIFKENIKKRNIIFSSLMNFLDSISLTNDIAFKIIMDYCNSFIYENKTIFQNIILRFEKRPTPKKKLAAFLMRTYTDASIGQAPMLNIFEDHKSNEDEEFKYDFYRNEEEDDDELNYEEEGMIKKTNLNCFSCIENNNEFKDDKFLGRKRNLAKYDDNKIMGYDLEDEEDI